MPAEDRKSHCGQFRQLWRLIRQRGVGRLLVSAVRRLRRSDGFSHARALAFQLCITVVPCLIALTGLAQEMGFRRGGRVIVLTTLAVTPGRSEALVRRLLTAGEGGDAGEAALSIGLISAMAALTSAMAQIQRGMNRIYGIAQDRRSARKYGHAFLLAFVAGIPAFSGFVLTVAGGAVTGALGTTYGWDGPMRTFWSAMHLPVALLLTVSAVALLFRYAPRRQHLGMVWLLPGIVLATALWVAVTGALAVYVTVGASFSDVYGPLTGVVALMLWAYASAVVLFFAVACTAELAACRARTQVSPVGPHLRQPQSR